MRPLVSMREALTDHRMFGEVLGGPSWLGWRSILIATMGEELTDEEREAFAKLTGRECEPGERCEELWAVVGRRGGKTRGATVLTLYHGLFIDWSDRLVPGERPVALLLGQNTKQARVARDYAVGTLESNDHLRPFLGEPTAEIVPLTTGVDLEIRAASFRGLRGVTAVCAIADECAYWFDAESGSMNADTEIISAVRPALATTGGPLIGISSPYGRRGELWNTYRRHYGAAGDPKILVAQGASRDFNPSLSQKVVDRAMERDPIAASAEYLGLFRSDLEAFVSREAVEACITAGVYERPPLDGIIYSAFVDPSGGRNDAMTWAIGHKEGNTAVIDLVREINPPFVPENEVRNCAGDLKRYRCTSPKMDRYGAEWVRTAFQRHGIEARAADKPKSDLYADLLPPVNSGLVSLLDIPRLVNQLCALERRTSRAGKDSIDHPPGGHDDLANVIAGVTSSILARRAFTETFAGAKVFAGGHRWNPPEPDNPRDRAAAAKAPALIGGKCFGNEPYDEDISNDGFRHL